MTVEQNQEESLRSYTNRFNKEIIKTDRTGNNVSMAAYIAGLCPSPFFYLLTQEPPRSMTVLMLHLRNYVDAEEAMNNGQLEDSQTESSQNGRKRKDTFKWSEPRSKRAGVRAPPLKRGGPPEGRYKFFTPLSVTIEYILDGLQDDPNLKWPKTLRSDPKTRSQKKYC